MPRPGDGSSHNGPFEEAGHNIAHGVGDVKVREIMIAHPIASKRKSKQLTNISTQTDKVPRADKTAPLPEGLHEKGAGLEGMNASGGQSQGIKKGDDVGQGKGGNI